jgi:parvulin-like peptidyl-prolyl isomerase
MIKLLLITLSFLVLALGWVGCGDQTAIAEVNGKPITRKDLDMAIEQLKQQFHGESFPEPGTPAYTEIENRVLQRLINDQILWLEANKMGITVSDEEIDVQIEQQKETSSGEEQFIQSLSQQGTSLDQFKENVRQSLLFQKMYSNVTKDVHMVTDEETLQFYNANIDKFQKPETRKVRHIQVDDEQTAKLVKTLLVSGADFAALANEYSSDPRNKNNGGELGEIPVQNSGLAPEIERPMAMLAEGQVSEPVKTQIGYDIIRVDKIIPPSLQPFDRVKEWLKERLTREKKQKVFNEWLQEAQENYEITTAEIIGNHRGRILICIGTYASGRTYASGHLT